MKIENQNLHPRRPSPPPTQKETFKSRHLLRDDLRDFLAGRCEGGKGGVKGGKGGMWEGRDETRLGWKESEGKGREGKGREGNGREGKGKEEKVMEWNGMEGKGREGKGREGKEGERREIEGKDMKRRIGWMSREDRMEGWVEKRIKRTEDDRMENGLLIDYVHVEEEQ